MAKWHPKRTRGDFFSEYALARYTSWRVGGAAEYCYRPADLEDLQAFLAQVPDHLPVTWLGSNVLVRDGGVPGVVILTLNRLSELRAVGEHGVSAQAGVTCAKLAKWCAAHGYEEGVFFAGIPGTVGGALAMNAGAFAGETWRHVVSVELLTRGGELKQASPKDFSVGYRQVDRRAEEYFASGCFQFRPGSPERAEALLKNLLKKRNTTQPIGVHSCGSVFRNPAGDFAARLVEASGLKGHQHGGAQVSPKHANFIVNAGEASAADIEALIHHVRQTVEAREGVRLVPEVHIIGEAGGQ